LFDDRAQEVIVHDRTLQSEMQKREKPDRVYGLRMIKRLERLLLWTEDKRPASGGKTIGESIRRSPFRHDGEPIVFFPFLALEAKSEKGRDGFSDVETQTAFTIHALLSLLEDLRKAVGGVVGKWPVIVGFSEQGRIVASCCGLCRVRERVSTLY
jgi:hypothetical protein